MIAELKAIRKLMNNENPMDWVKLWPWNMKKKARTVQSAAVRYVAIL